MTLHVLSIIPVVGGIATFMGFGAIVQLLWAAYQGSPRTSASGVTSSAASNAASIAPSGA